MPLKACKKRCDGRQACSCLLRVVCGKKQYFLQDENQLISFTCALDLMAVAHGRLGRRGHASTNLRVMAAWGELSS